MSIESRASEAVEKHGALPIKNAYVVSLHFSPAHASHMHALAKLLAELGFEVTFVLHEAYLSFTDFASVGPAISADKYSPGTSSCEPDIAIFCNAAIGNHSVAAQMRERGTTVFYIFHEPDSVLNHLSEGWRDVVKLIGARYCSIAMLRACSGVIVPSDCARKLYQRYFHKYNSNVHTMSLLLDDEVTASRVDGSRANKRYFSFIGNAVKAHDFDSFVAFTKRAIRTGSTVPFAIATRSDLSYLLSKDEELSQYANEKRIRIQHGRILSNDEINDYYLNSFCVWNIYKCCTQSGVLPRALMAGTPVIANKIGSFPEYIRPGANGEFVDSASDYDGILEAAESIRRNIPTYADECRRTFMETFFYGANRETLAAIIASAPPVILR